MINKIITEPGPELLKQYFSGKKKSPIYDKAKELYDALRTHAQGEYPKKLIGERRPHESEYVHIYRKQIYEPKSKGTFGRVVNSLGKIRRSSDWSIKYNKNVNHAAVNNSETLEQYCEFKFPYYGSLTNWTFQVLLKMYCIDANALLLISPLSKPETESEYLRPFPYIFNSDQILECLMGQYAVLKSKDKYAIPGDQDKEGDMWYVVTNTSIITYAQYNEDFDIKEVDRFDHNLGVMPIVKFKAVFLDAHDEYCIYESRLNDMVPELNEAVREYSDQQASIVNHHFPERWEWATQPCDACVNEVGVSTGRIKIEYGKEKKIRFAPCTKCGGTGNVASTGPFKKTVVRPQKMEAGEQATPVPPFGYVEKSVAIVESADKRIAQHLYDALAAVNMQFLMEVPLNQSGKAKEIDRDELNNFVYNVAEDIVDMLDKIYALIAEYRYKIIVPKDGERIKMLPQIAVPEKFDILSSSYLVDEIGKINDARLSAITSTTYEIDFCNKKFGNIPEVRNELIANFMLDPLPATTDDEKLARRQGGGVTEIDYIISCNVTQFIKRAAFENKDFYNLPFDKQRAIMIKFAEEVQKANADNPKPNPVIKLPDVPVKN